jgi:hypothetical protein
VSQDPFCSPDDLPDLEFPLVPDDLPDLESPLAPDELAAFEQGWAATVMPVHDGWKVQYFSDPSFEDEVGTTFSSLPDALAAISEMLPIVNSPEEKERARRLLRKRPDSP